MTTRYEQAVDYLERRLWHELPILPVERALQARVRRLLAHFGDPHHAFPVIHVGGSAGKGSTATIAASILHAAGLRTALYTSPHLQTFIERIAVDGRLIAPDDFADIVLGLDPLVREMHIGVLDGDGFGRPSLVEVAFAAGMKHFAGERCDAGVIEVGLGGRTDCTNVFDAGQATIAPVAVLTNIEFEHRERLGRTRAEIAREKAAIVHGGVVVTGAKQREALDVIEARCDERGAGLWRLGRDVRVRVSAADAAGSTIDVRTPLGAFAGLRLPLAGAHQAGNAAVAIAAALAFGEATGRTIGERAVQDGMARVRLSGRLELMQDSPRVLLDAAHNPVEARRLATALRTHWLKRGVRLHLVAGILGDKEQAPMVRALADVADRVVVTQPPLGERQGDPQSMLGAFARELGARNVRYEPSPAEAVDMALSDARPQDIVCITGSMFLVGAVRDRWLPESRILRRRIAAP